MTKEEAIQIIDSLDPAVMIKTTASNKQIREAIDMAVGALSKPSFPSDLNEAAEEALKKAYAGDAYYYVGRTGRRLFKEGYEQAEKDTIERAIQWLITHADDYIVDMEVSRYKPSKLHIGGMCWEDFKKAMEE